MSLPRPSTKSITPVSEKCENVSLDDESATGFRNGDSSLVTSLSDENVYLKVSYFGLGAREDKNVVKTLGLRPVKLIKTQA